MARNWTEAQRRAIYTKDADILVSAAAGSGKTAVLVERIIQKITDSVKPVDIDRLLVVTFTNAAAAEMRQRIAESLTQHLEEEPESEGLRRQLTLLPTASITTIHGFCHSLLRENFSLLGLDPNFKIADTTENELLRLSALEEVIEELYEDSAYAEAFLQLTEAYLQIKNPDPFYKLVNGIYDFVMSLPNPAAWLEVAAERFFMTEEQSFSDTAYAAEILACGKELVSRMLAKYDMMLPLIEQDDGQEALWQHMQEERAMLAELLSAESYQAFYLALRQITFNRIPGSPKEALPKYRGSVTDMRDRIKKQEYKRLREELFALPDSGQKELLQKLRPVMEALSELVLRLMARFDKKKSEKNILNFNDLEHNCLRLLAGAEGEPTPLARTVAAQYEEILIDEYQDTSALQEAIFGAIKNERGLFLVGDIKQSIYRFRNTNPLLFREKKERYSKEPGAPQQKIILSQNFRSRASVLAGINYIFSRIMSAETGEITYNEEEMLYPGAAYPEMEHPLSEAIELYITDLKELPEPENEENEDEDEAEKALELASAEAEAWMAAKRIRELLEAGYQVSAGGTVRSLRYRDICILLRSTKNSAECFAQVLSACGIPCYSEAGSSFLESEEIEVMLSLLKVIDNPHQDIPLLAVLRSQVYAFSADELAEIRMAERKADYFTALKKRAETEDAFGERLRAFLDRLEAYREKSRQMSTAELVWYLYMQTGFYEAQATLPGGVLRRLNLRLLYLRARAFEKTGLRGLYSFIRYVDDFKAIGGDYDAARTIGEEQNVVRIMSIHKSKGLEFPVVLVGGLARRFNLRDLQEKVLIHSRYGYGPQYIDTDLGLIYNSPARAVVKDAVKRETLSEEERILYVALTRAREKLILLAAGSHLPARINRCALVPAGGNIPGMLAAEAGSYLDWIFMALLAHPDAGALRDRAEFEVGQDQKACGCFDIRFIELTDVIPAEMPMPEEKQETRETDLGELQPLLERCYPYREETELPAKITVTELKRKFNEEEPNALYLYPRPDFLKRKTGRLTAAEAGTAMHTVLEHLDYAAVSAQEAILAQIESLQERGILEPAEAAAVSPGKLFAFVQSAIGQRLVRAEKVLREVSFSLCVDAEPIFGTGGQVMLQGIIDCVLFEEDGLSILDYKTDRVKDPAAIREKYEIQLASYAMAAEKIFEKPVRHRYLYLFDTGTLLEL